MKEIQDKMEKIVSLCKRRGFVYPGSEIYGGFSGFWDYGPLGLKLKENIKKLWRQKFVEDQESVFEIDAAIIMNHKVWEASGHATGFLDVVIECLECNTRYKIDNLIQDSEKFSKIFEDYKKSVKNLFDKFKKNQNQISKILEETGFQPKEQEKIRNFFSDNYERITNNQDGDLFSKEPGFLEMVKYHYVLNCVGRCPNQKCKSYKWDFPRRFNVMFKTSIGAGEEAIISYLRPETAQGIFANFKNIVNSFHPKLPFGIAQIGKAFRNEIAPRDFVFRSREFEQMEVEYFVKESEWGKYFEHWREVMKEWMNEIGINKENVHELEVPEKDRAHYSKRTIDFEFDFPFGRKELYGLAYRTNFDLKSHSASSSTDLSYFNEETGERIMPHVIEPSLGLDRTVLAILSNAYTEDELGGPASAEAPSGKEKRVFLKLKPEIAPIKVAVFPLLKNKPELVKKAREIYTNLKKAPSDIVFDDNGNIGKRYRRQDEIGTPFCVTVDFDTLEDDTVTLRDRDSGKQERVKTAEILNYTNLI